MTTVKYETDGPIARITLNRPEALNAFNAAMFVDLDDAVERFRLDDSLRVAIVSGEGRRAFSAGIDLKEVTKKLNPDGPPLPPQLIRIATPGYLDKPVVAAIRGFCVGEGLHLALSCDFRVCASDAVFAAPEVAYGIPMIRMSTQAVHTIGLPAALELCFLGQKRDAAWALRCQLVHEVTLPGEELAAAERIARRLCEVSFPALRLTKRMAWRALAASYEEVYAEGLALRDQVLATGEARARTQGFSERSR